MSRYLVLFERTKRNWSAYCPDFPGCVATGKTKRKVEKNMRESLILHLEGLRENRQSIPPPNAIADYVTV